MRYSGSWTSCSLLLAGLLLACGATAEPPAVVAQTTAPDSSASPPLAPPPTDEAVEQLNEQKADLDAKIERLAEATKALDASRSTPP